MTKLVMRLLGGFRVELAGEAVYDFRTDKVRALLAYLAVEADRPHRRETLAGLLWPDRPDSVARANLRQALWGLRAALRDHEPPLFLFVTPTDVQFNTAGDCILDVAELEAFARSPARYRQLLPEALCADFLAGFAVPDSETFQAWALDKQEQYHRLAIEILDEQNGYFERIGDYDRAVAAARLQLRFEPWLEEAHQRAMKALALAGHRDEALRQYQVCCRALEAELGLEPTADTRALYADIRAGRIGQTREGGDVSASPRPGVSLSSSRTPFAGLPAVIPASPRPRSPFVARADELEILARHLDAALAGETGVAFVSGDAGSGKTALLEAFAAAAMTGHPDLLVAGARCSPGGSLDPCAPLRRLAEMLFGDLANDAAWRLPGLDQAGRLRDATGLILAALDERGADLVETLVPAASIARRAGREGVSGTVPSRSASPVQLLSQGALFDQLLATVAVIAREQPLLLLLDDLHWVDDASAAFLTHLGRSLAGSRVLVVGAYRSAAVARGRRDPRSGETLRHPLATVVNELRTTRGEIVVDLDRADGRAFVEAVVDTEPNRLGARFRDALYAQTGGHALFTVETLRNLQARGELFKDEAGRWVSRDSLDWGALPARVEAAIAEHIAHLPETQRRILAAASVQGDDFAGEVVAELIGAPVPEVLACLSSSLARQHHLVRPEGMQRLSREHGSFYRFIHHLFQKYLYDQLDGIERTQLHAAVAASLDRQAGDDPAERERLSARLAWHYELGGQRLQAARALYGAGCQAMRVSAFREALVRFDHGLALLVDEPPSRERAEVERLLQVARLGPQRNLEGIGSASRQSTVARAAEAWDDDARGRPHLMILWATAERLFAKCQYEDGLAAARQLRDQATQSGEEGFVALAHWRLGTLYHGMGELQEAETHFRWVLDWLTPARCAEVRAAVGLDLEGATLAFSALSQWLLGFPETAFALSARGVTGALEQGSPYGQAFASAMGSTLLFLLRDETALAQRSEQCYRLCVQHGFGLWQAFAEVFLGRLLALHGQEAAGIERMQGGLLGWQGVGTVIGTDSLVLVLADTCLLAATRHPSGVDTGRAGLLATGLAAIDTMIRPGKDWWGPGYACELHRVRGELLLARDGPAAFGEASECFLTAEQLAREHRLLSPQLRAATSLVRLRQRQIAGGAASAAELEEARGCLRAVYACFTEGFAFPDLQDAAALLRETA